MFTDFSLNAMRYANLTMARKPAVEISLFFTMAFNAESHFKLLTFYAVHSFDGSVTLLACNFFTYMPLMVEQHVFGQIIRLDPWSRCIGIKIAVFFQNLRVFGNYVLVAIQAFFHRWNPGMDGAVNIGMTEPALNFFYTGVQPVTEGYGLFRTNFCARWHIKIIEKTCGQNCTDSRQ